VATNARVIENQASGERIVLLQTAAETDGRLLSFELSLRPGARVPAAHSHPAQEERFTVLCGRVRFRLRTRTLIAEPGRAVTVEAGTSHSFANVGEETARLLVEVRPALNSEELLVAAAELAATEGRARRLPRPVDLVLFLNEFEREVAVPLLPQALVRVIVGALGRLARVTGLDSHYRAQRQRRSAVLEGMCPPDA
jgi:quercetin dioxygenase-like cupin family protein